MKIITSVTLLNSAAKLTLACVLFFCIVNSVMSDSAELPSDTALSNSCLFSAEFTQQISKAVASETESSNGVIYSDCSHGLIMKTESPEVQTQIFTITNSHFLVDQQNNIQPIKGIAESLRAKLMLSIISSDLAYIEQHFAVDSSLSSELVMTPITKTYKRGLESLSVSSFESSRNIGKNITITILDKRGQSSTIVISDINEYDRTHLNADFCSPLFSKMQYCNILKLPHKYKNN